MSKTKARIIELFAILKINHGALWTSQFADKQELHRAIEIWHIKLFEFENHEIEFALNKCFDLEYPPSLAIFRKKCRIEKSDLKFQPALKSLAAKDKTYAEIMQSWDEYNFKRMPAVDAFRIYKELYANFVAEKLNNLNGNKTAKEHFIRLKMDGKYLLKSCTPTRAKISHSQKTFAGTPYPSSEKQKSPLRSGNL